MGLRAVEKPRADSVLRAAAILLFLTSAVNGSITPLFAADPLDVVINEVAWMGTQADPSDEWIELYNNTGQDINLTGWTLEAADGTPSITLSGTIPAHGYFLLERTAETTVSDIPADQIYTGGLENDPSAETLFLKDPSGTVIDTANGDGDPWPAGNNTTKSTMERIDPAQPDSDANWCTNDGVHRNGLDADTPPNPINGTPKARNSCTNRPPNADAGVDQTVNVRDTVQLDGSGSSDPDGDPLSYSWSFISKPTGSAAALSDPNIVNPTFTADVTGDYVLELTVDDGRGGTDSDRVMITAEAARDGDPSGDGKIDLQDAILAAKIALGLIIPTPAQGEAADVVPPCGIIDVRDVVRIAEVALGIKDESAFTCDDGSGEGLGITAPLKARGAGTIALRIADEEVLPGGRAEITVSTTAALEGLQVGPEGSLSFDPRVIQIRAIQGVPPFQVLASEIDNHRGRAMFIAIALGEPRSGEIVEVEVEAIGEPGEGTAVKLSPDMALDAQGRDLRVEVAEGRLTLGKAGPLRVERASSLPNPVRGGEVRFTVEGQGIKEIQVRVYDLSGREVFNSGWVAGETFEWNLTNGQGEALANGLYLYTVAVRGFGKDELVQSGVKRLVVLR